MAGVAILLKLTTPLSCAALVVGLAAALVVTRQLWLGRRTLHKAWVACALGLPLFAAVALSPQSLFESTVDTWRSWGVGSWRIDAIVEWCFVQAWRCGLAAVPALMVVGGTRLAANRIRPRPAVRRTWLHAAVVAWSIGQAALFGWGTASAVPVGVALGVGAVGWIAADTVRLGRSWKNGRLAGALAVLGWAVLLCCSVGALTAWRLGTWLDGLGHWNGSSSAAWATLLDQLPGLCVGALALVSPVLALVVRMLLRARVVPSVVFVVGALLAVALAQASGFGWRFAGDLLDLLVWSPCLS